MSLREWLIIIGALLILGVIVDGLRRMYRARQDSLEISRGMGSADLGESPVDDDYNPELPSGGARVVSPGRIPESRPGGGSNVSSSFSGAQQTAGAQEAGKPETLSASAEDEADDRVPVITRPQSEPEPATDPSPEPEPEPEPARVEPQSSESFSASDPLVDEPLSADDSTGVVDEEGIVGEVRVRKPGLDSVDSTVAGAGGDSLKAERDEHDSYQSTASSRATQAAAETAQAAAERARNLWQRIRGSQESLAARWNGSEPEPVPGGTETSQPQGSWSEEERPPAGANRPDAQEVIVINVLCRGEDRFSGPAIQRLLEACGMEFGDMGIYHRHEEPDTRTPVQFSVASAVSPGTFRPEEISELETPGISFFMSLPGPSDSIQAFDYMLETAQTVVRNLGGELKDENRSVMTAQTIEHCRQRIREYERRRRSVRSQ